MTSNYIPTLRRVNLLIYFRKNNSLCGKTAKYTTYYNNLHLKSTLISSCFETRKNLCFGNSCSKWKGGGGPSQPSLPYLTQMELNFYFKGPRIQLAKILRVGVFSAWKKDGYICGEYAFVKQASLGFILTFLPHHPQPPTRPNSPTQTEPHTSFSHIPGPPVPPGLPHTQKYRHPTAQCYKNIFHFSF